MARTLWCPDCDPKVKKMQEVAKETRRLMPEERMIELKKILCEECLNTLQNEIRNLR